MADVNGVKTMVPGKAADHARHGPMLLETTADVFLREPRLHDEAFGPAESLSIARPLNKR